MAWNDRISEAAYTSPGGTRQTFDYEDVSRSVEKKTTAFDFPDADGTYIQDLGRSGRQYPLRLFFWGADYDLDARAFEGLLLERGTGILEHPIYGTVNVVPFGAIKRRDDLKTAANQAVVEVTFWETIGLVYPTSQDDPASSVLSAVTTYNETRAEQFAAVAELEGVAEQADFKGSYQSLLDNAEATLSGIAAAQDNVRRQFDTIDASINAGIDALIADPISLAFETALLVQAPARAAADISARLSAYGDLAASILSGQGATSTSTKQRNRFLARDLYASGAVSGSVLSVVNNQFETKTGALQAAETVLAQFDDLVAWRDENYTALETIDTGEAYQALQDAVALTAGFLVFISFSLKQERRIVLDRARTIIDLAAELYGEVDGQLDFLISTNSLTGSEILELPAGREIVYYV